MKKLIVLVFFLTSTQSSHANLLKFLKPAQLKRLSWIVDKLPYLAIGSCHKYGLDFETALVAGIFAQHPCHEFIEKLKRKEKDAEETEKNHN